MEGHIITIAIVIMFKSELLKENIPAMLVLENGGTLCSTHNLYGDHNICNHDKVGQHTV